MEDGAKQELEGGEKSFLVLAPAGASQGLEDPQAAPSTLGNPGNMRGEGEMGIQCHPKDSRRKDSR